jgi:flavin reductase (DIM6/NTAB) family NADH-FMN oxidoreductase RutF
MTLASLAAPLRPLSLWSPIGLDAPQSLIDVSLESGGRQHDVTGRQVVLSLVPLVIGIGDAPDVGTRGELVFRDRANGRPLGTLQLDALGKLGAAQGTLACFAVDSSEHACLPAPLRAWQRFLQARRGAAPGFAMHPRDVQHLLVFYICPRPVFLVSVADAAHENLFPMDLVGEVGGGLFTLALRNTSPSIETLRNSRRAALADVPLQRRALAYSLGKHHHVARIDWSALPGATVRSARHGLTVPADSPRIRDVDILEVHTQGSHTVFVCKVMHEEQRAQPGAEAAAHLFHTSGIHRAWRRRQGALPWREEPA